MKGKSVTWIETGKVFNSVTIAANYFNADRKQFYNSFHRNDTFVFRKGVTLMWETYLPEENEEFRPVPGYEGLYKMSNKKNVYSENGKRLLKPAKTHRGAILVVLYSDGIPTSMDLTKLFQLTWPELAPKFNDCKNNSNPAKHASKQVKCLTDSTNFKSYLDCCKAYQLDYQEFRKALHKAVDGTFSYKGKEFSLVMG